MRDLKSLGVAWRKAFLATFASLWILICSGCFSAQDRYAQFASGGDFVTAVPNLSGDGKFVVFSTPSTGRGDIYRWDIESNKFEPLTSGNATEFSPIIAPDGESIAFARFKGGYSNVFMLNLKTRKETWITSSSTDDEPISFSPDGKYLVIRRVRGSGGKGNSVERIVVNIYWKKESGMDLDVAFAPDGKSIYFAGQGTVWSASVDDWNRKERLGVGRGVISTPIENKLLILTADSRWDALETDTDRRTTLDREVRNLTASGDGRAMWTDESRQQVWHLDLRDADDRPQRVESSWGTNRIDGIRGTSEGFLIAIRPDFGGHYEVHQLTVANQPAKRLFSTNDVPQP